MGEHVPDRERLQALLAEFESPEALLRACREARRAGYRRLDAFSPYPVEGLSDAIGFRHTRLPLLVLIGAGVGGVVGFVFQYWVSAIHYPLNVGGRPLNSWPAFVPVTFELTILAAALTAVIGMLALNGLPRPHNPLFAVPSFARATRDGFFLCVDGRDAQFDPEGTRAYLESLAPRGVDEVWR